MAGIKIVDLPALGRDLISTDLLEVSLNGSGSRKITGQEIMNASKLAVGSTPIVSGTVGRLLFQNTGDVLGQSANLFWDNTNGRLGVGTSSPQEKLDINGSLRIRLNSSNLTAVQDTSVFDYVNTSIFTTTPALRISAVGTTSIAAQIRFLAGTATEMNAGTAERMRIFGGGNIGINTTTDAGYRLDVNGTARVSGASCFGTTSGNVGIGTTDAATPFATAKGLVINAGAGNDVQIRLQNTTTGNTPNDGGLLSISNTLMYLWNYEAGPLILGAGNAERMRIHSTGNIGINTTTDDGFKLDVNGTARVQGALTTSAGIISNGTVRVTATTASPSGNASFFVFDGAEGTNFAYDYGTATYRALAYNGSLVRFLTAGTERARFAITTGNFLINTTTDAGFKLDVNGTARVVNTLAVNTGNTNGQGVQIGSDSNSGIYLVSGATQFRQYSSAFEFAGLGTNVFLRTDSTRLSTRANYGISLGTYAASTPEPSAILQAVSTTQGFLPPRMTNAQRAAIASPAVGLIVYCTDSTEGLYVYKSTGWTFMV